MKTLIKFFEWLYFPKIIWDDNGNYYQEKIVKIKGINCFLVDRYYGLSKTPHGRFTIIPIWNKERIVYLWKRITDQDTAKKQGTTGGTKVGLNTAPFSEAKNDTSTWNY